MPRSRRSRRWSTASPPRRTARPGGSPCADGLTFHDATPVLARDCVASVNRWGKRDAFGQALMAATDELSADGDKTIVFRLKRPFPLLPDALGKVAGIMCAIMPERLASTDAFKPITEMVGSGPFRYVAAERVPGALSVYTRFDGYVPRPSGTPSWTAGPKIAYLDRIEWGAIPDAATRHGRVAAGPSRLVAGAVTRPVPRPEPRLQPHHRHAGPVRAARHAALQPPAAAVRQPGDPPRPARCGEPGGLHAGGRGDRPFAVERRCRLLRRHPRRWPAPPGSRCSKASATWPA